MSQELSSRLRCRLVLSARLEDTVESNILAAIDGGDIASLILDGGKLSQSQYLDYCKRVIPQLQRRNIAALVVDDEHVLEQADADGILVQQPADDFRRIVARFSPHKVVGFGGSFSRHRALELGEAEPDFLLFGKIGSDLRPSPHPKNLALGEWWAKIIEIPCAIMAGSVVESVVDCAISGAEFVAVDRAIFAHGPGPALAVEQANTLLNEYAKDAKTS